MNTDVKSAGRILDMLEMFAGTSDAMGVSRVAEKLGIPKSSAQGLLATLTGRGYLARNGVEYLLPTELRGGWVGGARARLLLLAAPILKQMSEQSGESAFLSVLVGDKIQYLAKEISPHDVRYDASLAHTRPAYCTGSGLVLMGQLNPEVMKALLARAKFTAFTRFTVTGRQAILRWVERTRRDGYAITHGGYIVGGSGVAAPVFGPTGKAVAAVALGGPTTRFRKDRKRLIEIVVGHAAALSDRLSGVVSDEPLKPVKRRSKGAKKNSNERPKKHSKKHAKKHPKR